MNFLLRLLSNVHKMLASAGTIMLLTGNDIQKKTENTLSIWNLFPMEKKKNYLQKNECLNCFFFWKDSEK